MRLHFTVLILALAASEFRVNADPAGPFRSPVPFSAGISAAPPIVLPITSKRGQAALNSDASCAVTIRRTSDGSVSVAVETRDGARRGFFHYDRIFYISPRQYPLRRDLNQISSGADPMATHRQTYDGAAFEGRDIVAGGGGGKVTSYAIFVDRYLSSVSQVVITEYEGLTKDEAHQTSSLVCEAPVG